jgi:hypothetical protein
MILGDILLIYEVVISQLTQSKIGVKHILKHLKITTTLSVRNT